MSKIISMFFENEEQKKKWDAMSLRQVEYEIYYRQKKIDELNNEILTFGKYYGNTFKEVKEADPDYCKSVFKKMPNINLFGNYLHMSNLNNRMLETIKEEDIQDTPIDTSNIMSLQD